ncbi:MAG: TonB-dependent receptor [candidate division NC10 bacterium]|nr:TonB-dependent receptor [candidate division NC10 bacterium]
MRRAAAPLLVVSLLGQLTGCPLSARAEEADAPMAEQAPLVLQEVTVRDRRDLGYQVPGATTATTLETPILETPVSIQVVPRTVMDDQQVIELKEALKNVSGVQPAFGFGSLFNGFTIRGFTSPQFAFSLFRNGARRRLNAFETANVERIEVVKGPAAVLYGRLDPGGIVNLVTKRPEPEPAYSAQQQIGSFGLYRTVLDATGPVTADRSLLYQTTLAYHDSGSFRDFEGLNRVFLAPSLAWQPSSGTEVTLNLEYKRDHQVAHYGIPAIGTRPAPIPISRFLGDRTDDDGRFDHADSDNVVLELGWSHHFSPGWTLSQQFLMDRNDYFNDYFPPMRLLEDNRTLERGFGKGLVHLHSYGTNLDVTGRVEGWGGHTALIGVEYYRFDLTTPKLSFFFSPPFSPPPPFVPPIDIFNPIYGRAQIPQNLAPNLFIRFHESWYGAYLQDQIDLKHGFHLLVGGRYDVATVSNGFSTVTPNMPILDRTDQAFSPRVGLLYQPWPWVSVYGNFVKSIGPTAGFSVVGRPFEAERATQYEVGVKAAPLGGRLTATVALYRITKRNILSTDPSNPVSRVPIGEARSRGIELDVGGQLTDHWSVIGSYAYTDTRITEDTLGGNQGHRLPDVPLHSGSLWSWYRIERGAFSGLDVGAGVFAAGLRQGDEQSSFQLPGYARMDAAATYHWRWGPSRLTARLNIVNLLNQRYFESSNITDILTRNPRLGIIPGAPLTVLGSIEVASY